MEVGKEVMVPGLSPVGRHRSSGRWSIIHKNILPSTTRIIYIWGNPLQNVLVQSNIGGHYRKLMLGQKTRWTSRLFFGGWNADSRAVTVDFPGQNPMHLRAIPVQLGVHIRYVSFHGRADHWERTCNSRDCLHWFETTDGLRNTSTCDGKIEKLH